MFEDRGSARAYLNHLRVVENVGYVQMETSSALMRTENVRTANCSTKKPKTTITLGPWVINSLLRWTAVFDQAPSNELVKSQNIPLKSKAARAYVGFRNNHSGYFAATSVQKYVTHVPEK